MSEAYDSEAAGAARLRELVRRLETRLGLLNEAEMACCSVTLAQCHAVVELGRAGRLSLAALAEAAGVDSSAMSRTVQSLVVAGYFRRAGDEGDRRRVVLELTEAGVDHYKHIEATMGAEFAVVFRSLPADKRGQVLESLELLLAVMPTADSCCGGSK